ncbi:MAG: hypothetical protein P4M05_10105 [Bradyrhizobium sp.]|nr:hypothetical protein [Bradyrhizobium sp.]
MAGTMLFKINCNEIVLEGWRNFDDVDRPFFLAMGSLEWAMTLSEADHLAASARRAELRISWARAQTEPVKTGTLYRRQLQFDGEIVGVELGISDDGAIYFEFGGKHADLVGEQGAVFVEALARFAEEARNMRRASQPQYADPASGWPLLGPRQVPRR